MNNPLKNRKVDLGIEVGESFTRTTREWINAQGTDPLKEFLIVQEGKAMGGWVNMKTGKRIVSFMRRATSEDIKKVEARKAKRRKQRERNKIIV